MELQPIPYTLMKGTGCVHFLLLTVARCKLHLGKLLRHVSNIFCIF